MRSIGPGAPGAWPTAPDYAITLHAAPGNQPAPAARLAEDIAAQLALPLEGNTVMPAGFAAAG
jgi:hypothetical protein